MAICQSAFMIVYIILVPIPKSGKDASCSDNYHPLAFTSILSKILEHIILEKYSKFFVSNFLQFGFKHGSSTTTCAALVKSVVAKYNSFWVPCLWLFFGC